MPSFIIESIEFDFEDSQGVLPPDQQKEVIENTLGVWFVDDEDELKPKFTKEVFIACRSDLSTP